jgi:hypothetical protein
MDDECQRGEAYSGARIPVIAGEERPWGWTLPTMPRALVVMKVRTRFSLTREVRRW